MTWGLFIKEAVVFALTRNIPLDRYIDAIFAKVGNILQPGLAVPHEVITAMEEVNEEFDRRISEHRGKIEALEKFLFPK